MRGMARIGAPLEWLLSATTDLILRLAAGARRAAGGHRRGNRLHAARGGGGRPHPAGRDRDRRDGAAARRPPRQRGDDAAHADRVSRSRRSARRSPAADPRQRLFALSGGAGRHRISSPGSSRSRICSPPASPASRSICAPALRPPLFLPNTVTRAARARNVQEQRRADGAGRRRIRRSRRAGHADRHPRGAGRRHPGDRRRPTSASCAARTAPG